MKLVEHIAWSPDFTKVMAKEKITLITYVSCAKINRLMKKEKSWIY